MSHRFLELKGYQQPMYQSKHLKGSKQFWFILVTLINKREEENYATITNKIN